MLLYLGGRLFLLSTQTRLVTFRQVIKYKDIWLAFSFQPRISSVLALLVTRMLLGKIDDTKPGRVSYVYDQYMFHYTVVNSIIFLCMTDADKNGQDRVRLPYAFIEEIKDEFLKNYGERAQVLQPLTPNILNSGSP